MNDLVQLNLIRHFFKLDSNPLPPITADAFEYWVAENGIFIRGANTNLYACFPILPTANSIKGLSPLTPEIRLSPKVPQKLLHEIHHAAIAALPNEILFHLVLNKKNNWELVIPAQTQSPVECTPLNTNPDSSAANALIEVHSHGYHSANFSNKDDRDETGVRFYGILGYLNQPLAHIHFRVGIYGNTYSVPITSVFDVNNSCGFVDVSTSPKSPL